LVVTDDPDFKLTVKPGIELAIVEVATITPDLKKAEAIGARLCGYGSGTCLAIIET
jgi:hypothetical protein